MPRVVEITDPKAVLKFGGTKMLIAPPLAYDEIMKKVPKGKVITADYIRSYLARKHGADYTCQLTAGIFINIAAMLRSKGVWMKHLIGGHLKKTGS